MTPLQTLEAEILSLQDRLNLRQPLDVVCEMGTKLLKAKELIGHGNWQSWLARMGLRPRTAQTYMQVAKTPRPAGISERLSVEGFLRIIRMAKRAATRERLREAQANEDSPVDPRWQVFNADNRRFNWPQDIDLVAADPPWADIDSYEWLGRMAAGHLREGGILLAQTGVSALPEVIDRLRDAGLTYQWQLDMVYTHASGGTILHPWQANHRPILVFTKKTLNRKGLRVMSDVFTIPSAPKEYHEWEQPIKPWRYWLGRLARPGYLVCDPWAGSGTVGVACKQLGLNYLGTEIDKHHTRTARARINKAECGIPPDDPASRGSRQADCGSIPDERDGAVE